MMETSSSGARITQTTRPEVVAASVNMLGLTKQPFVPTTPPFCPGSTDAPITPDNLRHKDKDFEKLVQYAKATFNLQAFHFIHLIGPDAPEPLIQHFQGENAVHVWTQRIKDPYFHMSIAFRNQLKQQVQQQLEQVAAYVVPQDLGVPIYPSKVVTLTPTFHFG